MSEEIKEICCTSQKINYDIKRQYNKQQTFTKYFLLYKPRLTKFRSDKKTQMLLCKLLKSHLTG